MERFSITILSVFMIIFISCEVHKQEEDTSLEHKSEALIHQIPDGDMEILEIDGCEYLVYKEHLASNQGFGYLAHKGNCKNPIHCHNQTMRRDSTSELNIKSEQ